MKKFLSFFLSFMFVLCFILAISPFVHAEDILEDTTEQNTDLPVSENDTTTETSFTPVINVNIDNNASEPQLIDFQVDTVKVSANQANGFKAVLLSLFGDYEMVTKDYTYQSYSGSVSHSITTEPDYAWMISAAIFTVVLYCLFRLLGGVLCGRK